MVERGVDGGRPNEADLSADREGLEIAIIGMSCRFPGAAGVGEFWHNLREGVESVRFFSEEELLGEGISSLQLQDSDYVRAAPLLADIDLFDARFFGLTAREAQVLDPQQRLFLEVAWEALERAGHDPARFPGSIGVFGGASSSSYAIRVMANPQVGQTISPYQVVLSNEKDFLAARAAYLLDLRGPSVVVQAACSTSLVAVHVACQSLLAGECDMALAGGASVSVPQKTGYRYEPDGIYSRDGHVRAFDAEASGAVKGSGVGVVLLKRLSEALQDGDPIDAVIMGSATNNDGGRKVGFTAPGVDGQAEVVRAAQELAGVSPDEITYVEAHGTATALGDPIEVAALTEVFRSGSADRGSCGIGSVKSNFGHLDAAAGVAGLMKAVLMLKHGELVPSLHYRTPNPRIDFEAGPFRVVTRRESWQVAGRRRAGVSSFGMGGSNAHVVLEEPLPRPEGAGAGNDVLVVSALTKAGLERATERLVTHLAADPGLGLHDVAFTLRAGRRAFPHRRALACRDLAEAVSLLGTRDPQRVFQAVADPGRPVAFLLSGQGAQHVNMARDLYEAEPVFSAEVDACCETLRSPLGLDLRELLFPFETAVSEADRQLAETRFTQPALFTIEYALARLWMRWGVRPTALIGHSVGELVAACLAGVLERNDALALVAERARCMQACPRGAMTAVALSEHDVLDLLPPELDLCVVNGSDACVVGGTLPEIERLESRLQESETPHSRVATSHAFHSRLMEPALEPFAARFADVSLRPPRIPFISNPTGTWVTAEQATDPGYWVRQVRQTVRFSEGLATLGGDARRALLEVGPGHTLVALARRQRHDALAFASLPHPRLRESAEEHLLQTAARLWAHGVPVDLSPRDRRSAPRRVVLPTYPFERERHWLDGGPQRAPVVEAAGSPIEAVKLPVERWLYSPSWRRTDLASAPPKPGRRSWCVLAPDGPGLGSELVSALSEAGYAVTVVRPGPGYARRGAGAFTLDPTRAEDYERLLDELDATGEGPDRFVHLWGTGTDGADPLTSGFHSVVLLGRTLGARRSRETHLDVVTWQAQDVLGVEPLSPLSATVLGPCRVIPQEHPLVRCRVVDVDDPVEPSRARWLATALLADLGAPSGEPTVAYRGRSRWAQSFEPVESAPDSAPLRPRGVYLVTGGLGKVGLALAGFLARRARARLVLTGRSPLPDRAEWDRHVLAPTGGAEVARRIRALQELEAAGAEVLTLRADAANPDEMREAVEQARTHFGRIDGVVHAAAELGPGVFRPLAETGRVDCERQLRPKLAGAEVLERLLADDPPDFVLFTSSLSTVLGGLGLSAYAAANHALDAFARRKQAPGRGWVSVCWDGWDLQTGGSVSGSRLTATAISSDEGGEAFARALSASSSPVVVVSTTPLDARLERWTSIDGGVAPGADRAALHGERVARPQIASVYVTPEDPVDQRLAVIWAEMLGIDRVGADDSFFELGGSSLLAVHMMGRLRREYPVEMSVTTLFEAPTVRSLGDVIRSRQVAQTGAPPDSEAVQA